MRLSLHVAPRQLVLGEYSQCYGTFLKTVILAILTSVSSLVRQYIRTTNCSSFGRTSSGRVTAHGDDRATKLSVTSGHASHVFRADFFPYLVKNDVTSQQVSVWKNNNPFAICGQSAEEISWMGMYLKSFLVPNAIQNSSSFEKSWKWATASTTTSVSTVLIITDLKPEFMASWMWRSIQVSASSCEQGWSPSVFWSILKLTTESITVEMITLSPVSLETHSWPKNRKSSPLLSSLRGKFFQFPGSLPLADTLFHVPVPLFPLLESFKLSLMYTSQTISTHCVFSSSNRTCGMNTSCAYSVKVFNSPTGRKCTTAAPSRTLTSTDGVFVTAESFLPSRHPTTSDFCPCFILPEEGSDGGYFCFLCLKNSWRSPSLLWLAIYSQENNAQSLFSSVIFSLSFDGSGYFGMLKSKREFLGIGALIGVSSFRRRSLMKVWYLLSPRVQTCRRLSTTLCGITTCESIVNSSLVQSRNGFPSSPSTATRERTSSATAVCWEVLCSWCFVLVSACYLSKPSSYSCMMWTRYHPPS